MADENADTPEHEPRVTEIGSREPIDRTRHPLATGIFMALTLIVVGLVVFGLKSAVDDSDRRVNIADVEVPVLWGRTEQEALEILEKAGLIMEVEEISNDVFSAGTVFIQRPIPGAIVEEGSPVTAVVSTGVAGPFVPETVGQQASDAAALVGAVGLTAETATVYSEEIRVGEVVSSDPPAGQRAGVAGVVVLSVSGGPAPRTVPAADGRPSVEVLNELGQLDLVPTITYRHDPDRVVGTVISIDPVAGTAVPRGAEVAVVVNGAEPTVSVPGVVGLLEATATSAVTDAGLVPTVRSVQIAAGDPRGGRVISQGIALDADVAEGTAMEIVVGVAPPPPPTTTTSTTTTVP